MRKFFIIIHEIKVSICLFFPGHSCNICGNLFSLSAALLLHKSNTHSLESDGKPTKIQKLLEELILEETAYLSDESFNYTLEFSSKINVIPKIKIEELIENVITEPEFIKLEVNPWSLSQTIDSTSVINSDDLAEETLAFSASLSNMKSHISYRFNNHDPLATFRSRQSEENHSNVEHETDTPKIITSIDVLKNDQENFHHGSIDFMYSSDTELNTASEHGKANSSNYLQSTELDLKKWNCPKCLKSVYFTNLKRHFELVHKYNKPKALEAYKRAKTVRAAKLSENVTCLICSEIIYVKNMDQHLRVEHNVTDAIEFELLNSGRQPPKAHGSIQCLKCDYIAPSESHALVHNTAIHLAMCSYMQKFKPEQIDAELNMSESTITSKLQNKASITSTSSEINDEAYKMSKYEYLRDLHFICPICGQTGISSKLRSHFKLIHQISKSQTCQIINKNRNMLKVLSIPCPLCPLSFSSVNALSMHNTSSHPLSLTNVPPIILIRKLDESSYSCSFCESDDFSSRNEILYHICVDHKIEIQRINISTKDQFGCNICPYTTSIFQLYVHHEHQVHLLDHMTQPKIMQTDAKPKPRRKRKQPTSNDFLCNICGHASKTNHDLTMHMVTHSSDRPFICDICNRGFKKRETMREHLFVHSGEKRYACPVEGCDARFAQKAGLQQHKIRKHLPEERFKCEICDKKFVFLNKYKFVLYMEPLNSITNNKLLINLGFIVEYIRENDP